jgi:hypothetical protein
MDPTTIAPLFTSAGRRSPGDYKDMFVGAGPNGHSSFFYLGWGQFCEDLTITGTVPRIH